MSDKASIVYLAVDILQPNPFQPRDRIKPEDVAELSDSIKQYGILEPLVVAETPAGYQIIAGERRWRAAHSAGLKEVPVIVKQTSPREMLEMAIIENVQRSDLGPLERASAFQQLMRDFEFTMSEIAERISKSPSYVSNTLKLLDLPDAIKDGLSGKQISEGHARAIAGIEDTNAMINIYKRILTENASVRRAEEMARQYRQTNDRSPVVRLRDNVLKTSDPRIEEWEKTLQKILAAKSSVKLSRTNKSTRITITLKGDPTETQADLEKIMAMAEK